jgi:hypothetical protein
MLKLSHPSSQVPTSRLPESDSHYPVVAQLDARWRIIICRDGLQWILQRRQVSAASERHSRDDWRGRSYCRTKTGLVRCCGEYCGPVEPDAAATIAALAARIGGGS